MTWHLGRLTLGYGRPRLRWFLMHGEREYWWWTIGAGPIWALWRKTEAQIRAQYEEEPTR